MISLNRVNGAVGDFCHDADVIRVVRVVARVFALVVEENDIAWLGRVVPLVVDVAAAEPDLPLLIVGFVGDDARGDAGVVQAEADEHRAPLVIGHAEPGTVARPALHLVIFVDDEVARALLVADLGKCDRKESLSEVELAGEVRDRGFPLRGSLDLGNRDRNLCLSAGGISVGVGDGDGQLMDAKTSGHIAVAAHCIFGFEVFDCLRGFVYRRAFRRDDVLHVERKPAACEGDLEIKGDLAGHGVFLVRADGELQLLDWLLREGFRIGFHARIRDGAVRR